MCNIREVGNMNNTVSLTKQNGEKIQAEIISYFEIVGTQKRYLFYNLYMYRTCTFFEKSKDFKVSFVNLM